MQLDTVYIYIIIFIINIHCFSLINSNFFRSFKVSVTAVFVLVLQFHFSPRLFFSSEFPQLRRLSDDTFFGDNEKGICVNCLVCLDCFHMPQTRFASFYLISSYLHSFLAVVVEQFHIAQHRDPFRGFSV